MKKILVIIFLVGCLNSCNHRRENQLTEYSWELSKIVVLKAGEEDSTDVRLSISWDFKTDYSYESRMMNKGQKKLIKGDWKLNHNSLLMIKTPDTIEAILEKITDEEMIWIFPEEDSTRFYFNSKPKKVIAPGFPANK